MRKPLLQPKAIQRGPQSETDTAPLVCRFDFNVALQSYSKRLSNPSSSSNSTDPIKPPPPTQDFSLKAGQTFSIKIPGREGRKAPAGSEGAGGLLGAGISSGIPMLAPPPGKKR